MRIRRAQLAMRTAVYQLLKRARGYAVPVDLNRLAAVQGITRIEEVDLGQTDACLAHEAGGLVVRLNKRMPHHRRRFSLAHEIGHTLLSAPHPGSPQSDFRTVATVRQPRTRYRREKLCDLAAAEILMPEVAFRRWLSCVQASIRAIEATAARFDVSIEAAAIRFGEMVDAPVEIICWKPREACLAAAWFSGSRQFRRYATRDEMSRPLACLESGPVRALWSGAVEITNSEPARPGSNAATFYCESKALGGEEHRYVLSIVKPRRVFPRFSLKDGSSRHARSPLVASSSKG